MPPRRSSRYTFTAGIVDSAGRLHLTDRERFRFIDLPDNRQHVVKDGETLFTLAARFFSPLPRPAGLWWIIADFQSDPIHDPTLKLSRGTMLTIPSIRTVTDRVFNEERSGEI